MRGAVAGEGYDLGKHVAMTHLLGKPHENNSASTKTPCRWAKKRING